MRSYEKGCWVGQVSLWILEGVHVNRCEPGPKSHMRGRLEMCPCVHELETAQA